MVCMYIGVIILECAQRAERKMCELEKSRDNILSLKKVSLSLFANRRKESKLERARALFFLLRNGLASRSRNEHRRIDRLSVHL